MSFERVGIVERRQADRERYGRYAYRAPVALGDAPKLIAEPVETPPVEPVTIVLQPIDLVEKGSRARPLVYTRGRPSVVKAILEAVGAAYGVTYGDMVAAAERRPQCIARPRFAACKLLRDRFNFSYPTIGRALGQADHSTAVRGYKRACGLLASDAQFAHDYRAAEHALRAQWSKL
jgi:hypothetical protein